MTYSIDLRLRVVEYVAGGGSKAEAARLFKVSEPTVYRWCNLVELRPKRQGSRPWKLDRVALRRHVLDHPDMLLRERALHFNAAASTIGNVLRQMKITHKKKPALRRKRA